MQGNTEHRVVLSSFFCLILTEKMAPQAGSSGPVGSPLENEEQLNRRMMAKRQKIIAEMVQTERDYCHDLDLCIRTVVEPLRRMQVSKSWAVGGQVLFWTNTQAP